MGFGGGWVRRRRGEKSGKEEAGREGKRFRFWETDEERGRKGEEWEGRGTERRAHRGKGKERNRAGSLDDVVR